MAKMQTRKAAQAGQPAARRYAERRRDIDRLLEWTGQALAEHQKAAKADPRNWGHVGHLGHIRWLLAEVLAAIRGVDVAAVDAELVEAEGGLVARTDACPRCGEQHMDRLVWQNDRLDRVKCMTCGMRYAAPAIRPE